MTTSTPLPGQPLPVEEDPAIVPPGTPRPVEIDDPPPAPEVFPVREPDIDSPPQHV